MKIISFRPTGFKSMMPMLEASCFNSVKKGEGGGVEGMVELSE